MNLSGRAKKTVKRGKMCGPEETGRCCQPVEKGDRKPGKTLYFVDKPWKIRSQAVIMRIDFIILN